jgi:hypothetical protein
MDVPYRVVVEEQELEDYAAVIDRERLLVLDPKYQAEYKTYDNLGDSKPKGAGPARNFAWDHSISEGHERHWVMDDNLTHFDRYTDNGFHRCQTGTCLRVMEDFVLRYTNVAMAGPQYFMFVSRKSKLPPFVANTRIYSCSLIRNDIPFRWEMRLNEDTDLSLRILKGGYCTIQFNTFLQYKLPTQTLKGGNSPAYEAQGTYEKSAMLVRRHGDVARMAFRFGRIHHHVDYRPFRTNKLIRRDDITIPTEPNEYGLELVKV